MKIFYKHFVKDVVWTWSSLCHTNEVFRAANFKLFCCLKLSVIVSAVLEVAEVAQQSSPFVCSYSTVNANIFFGSLFHGRCNCMYR